ncbi:MAG: D-lyxose/D-mannose family sugar isomerase [Cyclobacteriaceae bacterium]|nr:D-lyxose/D-mannose family sugar isomerase [Cyclobacteriaceae bacterium]
MKRSEINEAVLRATAFFERNHWHLPPEPRWDVTDFGLGNFKKNGLVLVNLAEEDEYCEKLMYAQKGQTTPCHAHKNKKEDIICRIGMIKIQVWQGKPDQNEAVCRLKINGKWKEIESGTILTLQPGERISLTPGIYHEFTSAANESIIGEVSTFNDDENDNFFINKDIGRYTEIDEDTIPIVKLVSDE